MAEPSLLPAPGVCIAGLAHSLPMEGPLLLALGECLFQPEGIQWICFVGMPMCAWLRVPISMLTSKSLCVSLKHAVSILSHSPLGIPYDFPFPPSTQHPGTSSSFPESQGIPLPCWLQCKSRRLCWIIFWDKSKSGIISY